MHVQSGDKWGVFYCPECDGELTVTNVDSTNQELELGCENGHAWSVGTAWE